MQEAERLCLWAETHILSIRAEHILGVENVQADWLSRAPIDHSEWHLHPSLFREMTEWFRPSRGRPICHPRQQPVAQVLHQVCDTGGRRCRYPSQTVAAWTTIRLPSSSTHPEGHLEDAGGEGGNPAPGSLLAQEALVCRLGEPVSGLALEDPAEQDFLQSGCSGSSRTTVVPASLPSVPLAHSSLELQQSQTRHPRWANPSGHPHRQPGWQVSPYYPGHGWVQAQWAPADALLQPPVPAPLPPHSAVPMTIKATFDGDLDKLVFFLNLLRAHINDYGLDYPTGQAMEKQLNW